MATSQMSTGAEAILRQYSEQHEPSRQSPLWLLQAEGFLLWSIYSTVLRVPTDPFNSL